MLQKPASVPSDAGVYMFRRNRTPLYIGKAANIKKRLTSYFRKNASDKVKLLRSEATQIEWTILGSEIEALIKESELIKRHHPKYNILMRDDKNYTYVGFTKEEFPRIFTTHQPADSGKSPIAKRKSKRGKHTIGADVIGPFTGAGDVKSVLRLLRRTFPYCTCNTPHRRPCLNAAIGRCHGYCCLMKADRTAQIANRRSYRKGIRSIAAILSGRSKKLTAALKRDMRFASRTLHYERAALLRDQIVAIENIFAHRLLLSTYHRPQGYRGIIWNEIQKTLRTLFGTYRTFHRAESYDISNISGTAATASMAVFVDGMPEKNEYRKFKIRSTGPDDYAMLKETLSRRLMHEEWTRPDLILIDGGKGQLRAVLPKIRPADPDRTIAVAGLAKREEELFIEGAKFPMRLDRLPPAAAHFFMHLRDEAHRFAKRYHHKLREMGYRREHR